MKIRKAPQRTDPDQWHSKKMRLGLRNEKRFEAQSVVRVGRSLAFIFCLVQQLLVRDMWDLLTSS